MPSGNHFTFEQRLLLAFHFSELNNSPAEALESIFGYLEPPLETTLRDLWAQATKSCSLLLISTIIDMDASALFWFSNFI